ncbi:MAG TPA: SDR family oxidoreductase [Thermodesulfobacteriota bacterium]|nr:SDR family oxidoreductase [Thermodesulfobacteriota bacterium]
MVLITGGAGFIGSHLVQAVLSSGFQVRVLDNLSTGKRSNLAEATGELWPKDQKTDALVPLGSRAEFLLGDITDMDTCRKACRGVTHVFHLAALGSVQRSVEDPLLSHQVNATGTLQVFQAAREAGVKRVVYASSSSVYGNPGENAEEVVPKEESLAPFPESPYAASKLAGEIYGQIFSRLYGLETVSLMFFNVFGPRQDPQSIYAAVVPRFMEALTKGEPPVIYGDGEQSRDFTYVDNVTRACLLAAERPGIGGRVFNIACADRITVNHLLRGLEKLSGRKIPPRFEPARLGEVRHSLASIRRAREHLGYESGISFHDGLTATWNWFEKSGN